jgi:hypothetical protein
LVTASDIWAKVDGRINEAAKDSIGLDTAISSIHAVKTLALMAVATFGVALTGYSLAYASEKLIHYWDQYDQTNREACEDGDSSKCDTAGTSVQWDWIITHGITTVYAYFVLTSISYGGFIFYGIFNPLDDTP